jgi:hypothetical protein
VIVIFAACHGLIPGAKGQEANAPGPPPASGPVAVQVQPAGVANPQPESGELAEVLEDLGGPDSAPDDPPAPPGQGPPARTYGPPPPPRLAVDGWWIGPSRVGSDDSRLTMSFLSVSGGKRFTYGWTNLSIRPQFQVLFLGGPTAPGPDLPSQVYALTTDFQIEQPVSRQLTFTLGATPGLYTDWQNLSGEAVRVPARLFASYVVSPKLIVIGGAVYTAQPELPIIPAAGLIWKPSDTWRVDLIAPRPRVVYNWSDQLQVYGQFSFDASTYAVRSLGRDDLLEYRDFRVAMGTEWTTKRKVRLYSEVGAAFARTLDLMHQPSNNVEPGLFLRTGIRF